MHRSRPEVSLPMRLAPSTSESSIPPTMSPGTISLVPLTIASSAVCMSRPRMPPSCSSCFMLTSRLTEKAPKGPSCPVVLMITGALMVLGSMQDWSSWCIDTRVQLVTTPAMRTSLDPPTARRVMRSSTVVALKSLMLGNCSTLDRTVEVNRAACLTTTKLPSSSKGTPISVRKASYYPVSLLSSRTMLGEGHGATQWRTRPSLPCDRPGTGPKPW